MEQRVKSSIWNPALINTAIVDVVQKAQSARGW